VENAKNLPNLQEIGFYNNRITDAGLKTLVDNAKNFPNLQKIHVGNNQITEGFKSQIRLESKL
jgi:Leucine-rich repeat (LRR) protein